MNSAADFLRSTVIELGRPIVAGRSILLCGAVARNDSWRSFLLDAGARKVTDIDIPVDADGAREWFHAHEGELQRPSSILRSQLDAEDPDRDAVVYAGSFTAVHQICGRRVIGARQLRHFDAERKDRQVRFTQTDSATVALDRLAIDYGEPVVLQGVPREGIAMAASHTYLIPPAASHSRLHKIVERLSVDCDVVSLRAFDFGLPCTFYGFASTTWIQVFRPVRGLVYWDPVTWRIDAPGIAVPCPLRQGSDDGVLRTVVAAVERLHVETGYVGAFGTDGTLSGDSYTIHEVNPRICAGFSFLDRLTTPVVPLAAIDMVLRESEDPALFEPLGTYISELPWNYATPWTFATGNQTGESPAQRRKEASHMRSPTLLSAIGKDFQWN